VGDRQIALLIGAIVVAVLAAAAGIAFGAVFIAPVLFVAAIGLAGYGMTRVAAAISADSARQQAREEAELRREQPPEGAPPDPHRRASPHNQRPHGSSRRR
jgi:hypothetical protein